MDVTTTWEVIIAVAGVVIWPLALIVALRMLLENPAMKSLLERFVRVDKSAPTPLSSSSMETEIDLAQTTLVQCFKTAQVYMPSLEAAVKELAAGVSVEKRKALLRFVQQNLDRIKHELDTATSCVTIMTDQDRG